MTLIVTHISRFGIVHASDSNLTDASTGDSVGEGKKTFELPHLRAGMTVAGSYSVGGQPMDQWLATFVDQQRRRGDSHLSEFAHGLRGRLEDEMLPQEKAGGSIMHLAGYVEARGRSHPEFYSVRNVHGIDSATGEYKRIREDFSCVEEFWSFDCPRGDLLAAFERGAYQIYVNGFAQGRMSYMLVNNVLQGVFQHLWQQKGWRFRPPNTLDETEVFVETSIRIISGLFRVSDYSAPFIGGPIQVCGIPRPGNALRDL